MQIGIVYLRLIVMKKIVSSKIMTGGICMLPCFACLKKPRSIDERYTFIVRRGDASFSI